MFDNLDPVPEVGPDGPTLKRVTGRREKALRHIGSHRVTNDTYSQPVIIPPDAEFFCAFAESGDSRLAFDGLQATITSPFIVFEEVPIMFYPIAPGQTIMCYGAAATFCNFDFLGRIYPDE
jgi:hypothetical protein